MILPGPKRDYTLALTLALAEKLEKQGSLLGLADRLTAGAATPDDIFIYLKIAYQAAGCLLPGESLRRFLETRNPDNLLAELLLGLLSPLLSMGAAPLGEAVPARAFLTCAP